MGTLCSRQHPELIKNVVTPLFIWTLFPKKPWEAGRGRFTQSICWYPQRNLVPLAFNASPPPPRHCDKDLFPGHHQGPLLVVDLL